LLFRFKDSSDALTWFIENVLPFVNCKSELERQNVFFRIWQNNSDLEEFADTEKHFEGANEFYSFVRRLMLIAFSFEYPWLIGSQLEMSDRTTEDVEKRIKDFLTPGDLWIRWNEKMCFAGNGPQIRLPVEYIEQLVVHSIVQCFYVMPPVFIFASAFADNELPPKSDFIKGPGFEKVGLCPNCGIFFERKRKNQEFCTNRCANTFGKRRDREKKKRLSND